MYTIMYPVWVVNMNFDGYVNSVDWNGGMERWIRLLEWSTGLDSLIPRRISNLGVLCGVKGQYMPILTLYQRTW